jgi:phosphate transport system substrate-binding protein
MGGMRLNTGNSRRAGSRSALMLVALVAVACGGSGNGAGGGNAQGSTSPAAKPSGQIRIDGSSTVYPITEAVAEQFQAQNPDVRVTVAFSGTGGGFKKFCSGQTEANDASRPINSKDKPGEKSEATACKEQGVTPVELPVAIDGLSVLVNPANDFVKCLTVQQLNQIWKPDSTVRRWSDVNPAWPAQEIKLYGPGADSGTFDYFTAEINGEEGASRSDYTQSEDDNALVQGISGDRNALGYFGYAYYAQNKDRLKAVQVDGGQGCVDPTEQTIGDGSYKPLSRPLFVYVSSEALKRPEVSSFFQFYLNNVSNLVGDVGYIPLPTVELEKSKRALAGATAAR